jgi:predicted lipoprotein with Yx(FWY)xxD motif
MRLLKRFLPLPVVSVVAAVVLAACGSSGGGGLYGGGNTTTPATPATASRLSKATVTTSQIGGVGRVLVDASGLPLYVNEQDGKDMSTCDGSCAQIWVPATVSNGSATSAPAGVALGVATRADGSKQLTLNGKPLYTFKFDQAGQVSGNGFHDAFNGRAFTWHVALASGSAKSTTQSTAGTGGGSTGRTGMGMSSSTIRGY